MAKKFIKSKKATKGRYANPKNLSAVMASVQGQVSRAELPEFRVGDTVKVFVKIKEGDKERAQVYEGVVIARSHGNVGSAFTVRKMSHGVGVERVFLEHSPKVAKVEIVSSGRVRRAKLYYLRELEGKKARLDRDMRQGEEAPATKE